MHVQGKDHGRSGGRRKQGHKQMLGQAAAMLVSLPAVFTAEFGSVESPALLGVGLAVAGPSTSCLLEGIPLFRRRILLVVDGAVLELLPLHVRILVDGHAGRWRGQAGSTRLGHPPAADIDRQSRDLIIHVSHCCRSRRSNYVCVVVRDTLTACDAVGGIERPWENRVGVCTGVGLSSSGHSR